MKIEVGTEYKISEHVKQNFNFADALTVIRHTGSIVQFTLNGKNGHGSMPIQHLQYLLKKNQLTQTPSKRQLLLSETDEEQIV
ncbi:MAG: hypothetical protein ACK4M9_03075 [Anaerobacillus sp.]|jgi:hypothetical protein|uniref:hypothetical protein n=1 Tax=Anaerobacillus sp. TaxID=1872506 RepID=UPI00391AB045